MNTLWNTLIYFALLALVVVEAAEMTVAQNRTAKTSFGMPEPKFMGNTGMPEPKFMGNTGMPEPKFMGNTGMPDPTFKGKSGMPELGFAGKGGKPDAQQDLSKLSMSELLAQAKEVTKKTREDLEAARGISIMKQLAETQKATLDSTCSRVMGETLKKLTDSAMKTHADSISMAKEVERRLNIQKSTTATDKPKKV